MNWGLFLLGLEIWGFKGMFGCGPLMRWSNPLMVIWSWYYIYIKNQNIERVLYISTMNLSRE